MKQMIKAVSPIVATVILVIITAAAALLLWSWISGVVTSSPSSSATNIDRLRVSGVKLEKANNNVKLTVYVHNIGNSPAEIVQLAVFDVKGNLVDITTSILVCPVNSNGCNGGSRVVTPNSLVRVEWNIPLESNGLKYEYGYLYFISVVTASGFEVRSSFVWDIQM